MADQSARSATAVHARVTKGERATVLSVHFFIKSNPFDSQLHQGVLHILPKEMSTLIRYPKGLFVTPLIYIAMS